VPSTETSATPPALPFSQPIQVTDQGVTAGMAIPIPCPTVLPATSPLQVGGAACVPSVTTDNITLQAVNPQKTVNGSHATITAAGLDVTITQPAVPGAPQQKVEYILGEAFVDAFNDPSASSAGSTDNLGGTSFDSSGDFGYSGDFGSADAGAAAPPPASAATHMRAMLVANRQPLALLFLFWETLVLGAAAAWVWARRRPILPELGADA